MRTEEDLRALFTAREELAPDQDVVLEGARHAVARRRRRRAVGAAAAAAVVAVALPVAARGLWAGPGADGPLPAPGGPVAGTASAAPDERAPSGPRPPFAFTIRPVSAAGYEIRPTAVNPDLQLATVRGPDGAEAHLTVYQPGVEGRAAYHLGTDGKLKGAGWDADADADAERVAVGGAPAWYSSRDGSSSIRWEHAPGGWAVINATSPDMSRETLIALAEAVRFTAPVPAKVPYRLGYLPAGFKPFHFSQGGGAESRVVQFEDGDGHRGVMDIAVRAGSAASKPGWRADRTMAGRPADCTDLVDGRRCVVDFGTFTVDVGAGDMPVAEMARIVAGMSFADWGDPAGWYDLDAALPGR